MNDSVNILDTIMSEAQRQGRLSFYMVSLVNNKKSFTSVQS